MKIKNKYLLTVLIAILAVHLVSAQWSVTGDYTISGKVGIGTLTPEAKFEIQSSGTIGGIFDPSLAFFKITDGTTTLIADGNEIHSNQSLVFGSSYTRDFKFRNVNGTGFQDLLIIKSTGNVGIGIETPEEKLEVDGNVQIGYNQFLKGRRVDNMISNLIGYIPHESGHHVLAFSEYSSILSEVRIYTPSGYLSRGKHLTVTKGLCFSGTMET